jgi:hypothetical protein
MDSQRKKKKGKRQQKQPAPVLIQFSENDNAGKTTDAESYRKPVPGKKTVMQMPSLNADDSDTIPIKSMAKKSVNVIDETEDEESIDDNDIEFEDDLGKDKPNPMPSVPSKPAVKFIEQPSKTDFILSKPKQQPPQQKKQPMPKKKAGGDMKAKAYSMETSTPGGSTYSVESSIAHLKDSFDFHTSSRTPQFYDAEKINEIHNFLTQVTIHIKNNPFYMFASEVATSIGKMNESIFIHSTVQEIIRIITANGKLDAATSDYHKRFNMYAETIKSMNNILKTMPNSFAGASSSSTEQLSLDQITSMTETQRILHENFRNIKMVQNEMDILKKILTNANLYLSSKFYFSSTLISLINTAMGEINLAADADGFVDTSRKYDPEKIIASRPELRNQLAQLCGLIYNRNLINTGSRYVTEREALRNLTAIKNMALIMKESLSRSENDDLLDDGLTRSTPIAQSPLFSYTTPEMPQLMQYAQESIFAPPPGIQAVDPYASFLRTPSPLMPSTSAQPIPEYGSPTVTNIYGTPSSMRSSGTKKRYETQTQLKLKYHIPKKYRQI